MSEQGQSPNFAPRQVRCPACSGNSLYTSEEFKLPDEKPLDEPFGDPRLQ
jgi:hypothetical protein